MGVGKRGKRSLYDKNSFCSLVSIYVDSTLVKDSEEIFNVQN